MTGYPGAPARQLTMTEQEQSDARWARSMSPERFAAALLRLRDSPRTCTPGERHALLTDAIRRELARQPEHATPGGSHVRTPR